MIVFILLYVHEKKTETLDILSPPGDINPKHAVIKTLVWILCLMMNPNSISTIIRSAGLGDD